MFRGLWLGTSSGGRDIGPLVDGLPTTRAELDENIFLLTVCGDWLFEILMIQPVVGWTVLSGHSQFFVDPLKNLIMQQHLLSPVLPSSPTNIRQQPAAQVVVPSPYLDSPMTATITTTTTVKRKRTDLPDSVSVTKPVVKKKKANRACIHCQKAHLTCDDCSCSLVTCCARFLDRAHDLIAFFPAL